MKILKISLLLALIINGHLYSQITVYSNNNVGVKTNTAPTEAMEVNGNAKATYFIGDGSKLTNFTFLDTTISRKANYIYAAPNGSEGMPSFRALKSDDLPSVPWSKVANTPTTLAGYGITDATGLSNTFYQVVSATNVSIRRYTAVAKGGVLYLSVIFTPRYASRKEGEEVCVGGVLQCPALVPNYFFGVNTTSSSNTDGGVGFISGSGSINVRLGKGGQEYCFFLLQFLCSS
ncbi:MAG TPA: hypothetical protein VHO90_17750 [Bacteroidales bacterium]|nr:hypothetical protein [Bacteroidales bacterium]